MCGIAGFLEWATADRSGGAGARPRLERMLRAVEHRGPDDWGMAFFGLPADCRDREREHVRPWIASTRGGDDGLWRCLSLALWMRSEEVQV